MSDKLMQLRRFIANYYNLDELKTLCFDLRVDYDELGEGGKTARVRELLLLIGGQYRFDDLLSQLEHDRPEGFRLAGFDTNASIIDALCTEWLCCKKLI